MRRFHIAVFTILFIFMSIFGLVALPLANAATSVIGVRELTNSTIVSETLTLQNFSNTVKQYYTPNYNQSKAQVNFGNNYGQILPTQFSIPEYNNFSSSSSPEFNLTKSLDINEIYNQSSIVYNDSEFVDWVGDWENDGMLISNETITQYLLSHDFESSFPYSQNESINWINNDIYNYSIDEILEIEKSQRWDNIYKQYYSFTNFDEDMEMELYTPLDLGYFYVINIPQRATESMYVYFDCAKTELQNNATLYFDLLVEDWDMGTFDRWTRLYVNSSNDEELYLEYHLNPTEDFYLSSAMDNSGRIVDNNLVDDTFYKFKMEFSDDYVSIYWNNSINADYVHQATIQHNLTDINGMYIHSDFNQPIYTKWDKFVIDGYYNYSTHTNTTLISDNCVEFNPTYIDNVFNYTFDNTIDGLTHYDSITNDTYYSRKSIRMNTDSSGTFWGENQVAYINLSHTYDFTNYNYSIEWLSARESFNDNSSFWAILNGSDSNEIYVEHDNKHNQFYEISNGSKYTFYTPYQLVGTWTKYMLVLDDTYASFYMNDTFNQNPILRYVFEHNLNTTSLGMYFKHNCTQNLEPFFDEVLVNKIPKTFNKTLNIDIYDDVIGVNASYDCYIDVSVNFKNVSKFLDGNSIEFQITPDITWNLTGIIAGSCSSFSPSFNDYTWYDFRLRITDTNAYAFYTDELNPTLTLGCSVIRVGSSDITDINLNLTQNFTSTSYDGGIYMDDLTIYTKRVVDAENYEYKSISTTTLDTNTTIEFDFSCSDFDALSNDEFALIVNSSDGNPLYFYFTDTISLLSLSDSISGIAADFADYEFYTFRLDFSENYVSVFWNDSIDTELIHRATIEHNLNDIVGLSVYSKIIVDFEHRVDNVVIYSVLPEILVENIDLNLIDEIYIEFDIRLLEWVSNDFNSFFEIMINDSIGNQATFTWYDYNGTAKLNDQLFYPLLTDNSSASLKLVFDANNVSISINGSVLATTSHNLEDINDFSYYQHFIDNTANISDFTITQIISDTYTIERTIVSNDLLYDYPFITNVLNISNHANATTFRILNYTYGFNHTNHYTELLFNFTDSDFDIGVYVNNTAYYIGNITEYRNMILRLQIRYQVLNASDANVIIRLYKLGNDTVILNRTLEFSNITDFDICYHGNNLTSWLLYAIDSTRYFDPNLNYTTINNLDFNPYFEINEISEFINVRDYDITAFTNRTFHYNATPHYDYWVGDEPDILNTTIRTYFHQNQFFNFTSIYNPNQTNTIARYPNGINWSNDYFEGLVSWDYVDEWGPHALDNLRFFIHNGPVGLFGVFQNDTHIGVYEAFDGITAFPYNSTQTTLHYRIEHGNTWMSVPQVFNITYTHTPTAIDYDYRYPAIYDAYTTISELNKSFDESIRWLVYGLHHTTFNKTTTFYTPTPSSSSSDGFNSSLFYKEPIRYKMRLNFGPLYIGGGAYRAIPPKNLNYTDDEPLTNSSVNITTPYGDYHLNNESLGWSENYEFNNSGNDTVVPTNDTSIGYNNYTLEYFTNFSYYTDYYINNYNLTMNLTEYWNLYYYEHPINLFQLSISMFVPIAMLIMFPLICSNFGSRRSVLGIGFGTFLGFIVLGYIGYLSLVYTTILAIISIIGTITIYRSKEEGNLNVEAGEN